MRIISAEEVANYVVCPEAWRLKYIEQSSTRRSSSGSDGTKLRKEWAERQDLSSQLRKYAKIVYMLLVCLVIIVFLLEQRRALLGSQSGKNIRPAIEQQQDPGETAGKYFQRIVRHSHKAVPTEILLLLLVLGVLIFLWDLFERRSSTIQKESGLSKKTEVISAKGSSELPAKKFQSSSLGLSSKPDALLKSGRDIIPVDIQPLTNKVRDRHVIPVFVHLRLIEEEERIRPPHGVLIMGKKKRRVEIKNSPEKQRWLDSILDEMRSIIDGVPAVPAPAKLKCKNCDVREICEHSAYIPPTNS